MGFNVFVFPDKIYKPDFSSLTMNLCFTVLQPNKQHIFFNMTLLLTIKQSFSILSYISLPASVSGVFPLFLLSAAFPLWSLPLPLLCLSWHHFPPNQPLHLYLFRKIFNLLSLTSGFPTGWICFFFVFFIIDIKSLFLSCISSLLLGVSQFLCLHLITEHHRISHTLQSSLILCSINKF